MGEVDELEAAVAAAAATFDVNRLTTTEAVALVPRLTRLLNTVSAMVGLAAARAAEAASWGRGGADSAAGWLARTTGTSAVLARARLATGVKLRSLDATRAAALAGGLSPMQLDAVVDAAAANPTVEVALVGAAGRESLGELRDRCARVKAAADPDPEATDARVHRERRAWSGPRPDGSWTLQAATTIVAGAEFDAVWNELIAERFSAARDTGAREPREAYAADALVDMARRCRAGAATRKRRDPVRYLTVVHADLDALVRGSAIDGERCEIPGLGPIPVTAARDLLGESVLKLVLTRGRDANVTHLGRGPNAAQKLVLLWRAPRCDTLGCHHRQRLEADHREDFARTRDTTLEELEHLCHSCHDKKTRFGWALVAGTGKRPLVPPSDPRHPRRLKPPDASAA